MEARKLGLPGVAACVCPILDADAAAEDWSFAGIVPVSDIDGRGAGIGGGHHLRCGQVVSPAAELNGDLREAALVKSLTCGTSAFEGGKRAVGIRGVGSRECSAPRIAATRRNVVDHGGGRSRSRDGDYCAGLRSSAVVAGDDGLIAARCVGWDHYVELKLTGKHKSGELYRRRNAADSYDG